MEIGINFKRIIGVIESHSVARTGADLNHFA